VIYLTVFSVYRVILSVPGGKVNVLGGHNIGNCKPKSVYVHVCLPNGFRDRTLSLYRRAKRHALTRVAKCIDVYCGIFENVLNYINCTNFVT
jgi:hypothetical protein